LAATVFGLSAGCTTDGNNTIKLTVVPAELAEMHGPLEAKGLIIYTPGNYVDSEPEPLAKHVPTYLQSLSERGWDVYRANVNYFDQYTIKRGQLARKMMALAADWRKVGYKRVVLAGQSAGAWNAILGLKREPNNDAVYAVLSSAPSGYGRTRDNLYRDNAYQNASKLYEMLEEIPSHVRIGLFFFTGDENALEARGPRSEEILTDRGIPHLVLDNPPAVAGHSGAWMLSFDRYYGKCVAAFLDPETEALATPCPAPELSDSDHLWLTRQEQLEERGATAIDEAEFQQDVVGKLAKIITNYGYTFFLRFEADGTYSGAIRNGPNAGRAAKGAWHYRDGALCIRAGSREHSTCSNVFRWSDGAFILTSAEDGTIHSRFKLDAPTRMYSAPVRVRF
jgi:hypothetical protein